MTCTHADGVAFNLEYEKMRKLPSMNIGPQNSVLQICFGVALSALATFPAPTLAGTAYNLVIHNNTGYKVMVDVPNGHCTHLWEGEKQFGLEPGAESAPVKFSRHGGKCDGKQGYLQVSAFMDTPAYQGGMRDFQEFWYSNDGGFAKHGKNSKYESKLEGSRSGNYKLQINTVFDPASGQLAAAPAVRPEPAATLQPPQFRLDPNGQSVSFNVMGYIQNAKGKQARLSLAFFTRSDSGWTPLSVNPNYRDSQQLAADTRRFEPIQTDSHALGMNNMTIPGGAFDLQPRSEPYRLRAEATLSVDNIELGKSPPVEFDYYMY